MIRRRISSLSLFSDILEDRDALCGTPRIQGDIFQELGVELVEADIFQELGVELVEVTNMSMKSYRAEVTAACHRINECWLGKDMLGKKKGTQIL